MLLTGNLRSDSMKKAITLITAFTMIFAASSVYACGEGSTNSGKADVSKAAKTTTAASVKQVNVKTAEATVNTKNDYKSCYPTGDVKSVSGKAGNAKVKDVSGSNAGYNCPSSPSCPVPCRKDVKSSADKSDKSQNAVIAKSVANKESSK